MNDWLLVMPVPGITQRSEIAINQVLALIKPGRPLGVSIVDTFGDPRLRRLCASSGASYVKCVTDPFAWGYAANIGAFAVEARKLCFLHSDIEVPAGIGWLDALAQVLDQTHGLVAPVIDGSSPNPLQHYRGPWEVPYYHTTSYISNCCLTIEAQRFRDLGAFHPALTGSDWWANYLQERLTKAGLPTVIVPASKITHTSQDAGTFNTNRNRNMQSFCGLMGIRSEYSSRPSEVRSRTACDRSLAIIVDGFVRYNQRLDLDGYDELVVVDTQPSVESFQKCQSLHKRWKYSPSLDEHPERLAAELSGGVEVTLLDRRVTPIVVDATGKPWRNGHGYALPQHLTDIHITNAAAGAVGDTLMMTPALSALKRTYPWLNIHLHSPGPSASLLLNNPAVASLDTLSGDGRIHPEAVPIGYGVGCEGTVSSYYRELGLDYPDSPDPIVCVITDQEKQESLEVLTALGIDASRPIVGLQMHGNWMAKNWARTSAACKILVHNGWQVVTFGTDSTRSRYMDLEGVAHLRDVPLRTAVAVISILDGMIGFDSGLSYAAAAVGTPCVCLFGPHDPGGLIFQGGGGKLIAIRKRTPMMCKTEFGKSCREDGHIGSHCVLRDGTGGRCIDEISVHDVLKELETIVRRK